MSSGTCGLSSSSSSIFGGLCSGNSRRPSMFTAKYRLREERKKVLKMSMGKVKRIEDPESFLRRSVLINNTIKRLQREVREEKMVRHGGYTSKLSCSFRKSFACSRLSDMHLPDEDSLGMSSPSSVNNQQRHDNINNNNYRKRPMSDDSEDDCDVQAVLNQIYVPPTPCIISSIDEDENSCDSTTNNDISPTKKAKLSLSSGDMPSAFLVTDDECSLDVDVDVDVVGDSETSDWPTPPSPPVSEPIISCNKITTSAITTNTSTINPMIMSSAIDNCSVDVETIDVVSSIDSSDSLNINNLSQVVDIDVDVDSNSSDCDFSLDLPSTPMCNMGSTIISTTNNNHLNNVSTTTIPFPHTSLTSALPTTSSTTSSSCSSSSSHEIHDVEDMILSSDTKENTCTLPLSSSCCSTTTTLIPSADRKSSSHGNHSSGGSPNSISMSPPSTDSSSDKQYSSCGHSMNSMNVFGELQSSVFHSLITSLET